MSYCIERRTYGSIVARSRPSYMCFDEYYTGLLLHSVPGKAKRYKRKENPRNEENSQRREKVKEEKRKKEIFGSTRNRLGST